MADYKELLRKAIQVLPENNGAARRAVYEKARTALVGQLRGIDPPLPAREITQHRLQLEDCIRQVEQEASEAVISGLGKRVEEPHPIPVPHKPAPVVPQPEPVPPEAQHVEPAPEPTPEPVAPKPALQPVAAKPEPKVEPKPEPKRPEPYRVPPRSEVRPSVVAAPVTRGRAPVPEAGSIEDIIAQAEQANSKPAGLVNGAAHADASTEIERKPASEPGQEADVHPLPVPASRPEPLRAAPPPPSRPFSIGLRAPKFEPRRDANGTAAATARVEPGLQQAQAAAQRVAEPITVLEGPVTAAMSSVREVDVDPILQPGAIADSEAAIGRAIATLDREARGETQAEPEPAVVADDVIEAGDEPVTRGKPAKKVREKKLKRSALDDDSFAAPRPERERGGGAAITIFLLVFVILLAGAGGAGYWAWREGYIDLAAMFGQNAKPTEEVVAATPVTTQPAATPVDDTDETDADVPTADGPVQNIGPGNTETTPDATAPTAELTGDTEDRLPASDQIVAAETNPVPQPAEDDKSEERLPAEDTTTPGTDAGGTEAVAPDASVLAGSQSLLLEASDDGTTGAVPFSGTVEWTEGTDETGQPTLVAKANIPARNLGVDVLIRRNTDPTLPASHLMEINFSVSEGFMGGSIAGLPGVLLKNEELVQGTPLAGASARVVGNSFLFALSASAADLASNDSLLTGRKWMDLAIIYATGKRAIITLEKDEAAEALFNKVFAAWASAPATTTPVTTTGG